MGNICLLFISTPNRGGCSQGCQNTIGSYSCYCGTGYTLNSDEKSCNNINECLTTHNCYSKEFCTDTDGFYTCSCPEHFILKVILLLKRGGLQHHSTNIYFKRNICQFSKS